MTWPLILLAIPSIFLGMVLGLPFGAGLINQWLEPVFHESVELLGHHEEAFQLFGIDGALILASVAVAVDRHRDRLAAVRRRDRRDPAAGRSPSASAPSAPASRSSTARR